jgi:hypothetical protein
MRWAIMVGVSVLALAACKPGGPGAASGPDVKAASAAAHKAADQFVALAKGSGTSGQVPRQTDATVGPLLNAVFDTSALASAAPPPFSELSDINDWLMSVERAGQVYVLAGTGISDFSAADNSASGAALDNQAGKNLITYQPEIGRYMDAEVSIMGAEAVVVANEMGSGGPQNALETDGLAKIRSGVTQTTASVLATIDSPGLPDDWRQARAKALAAAAPKDAKLLQADSVAQLRTLAGQVSSHSQDAVLKASLAQFSATIGPP